MKTEYAHAPLKPVQKRLMIPLVIGLLLLIIGFIITQATLHNKQLSISSNQQVDNTLHTLELIIQNQTKLLIALQNQILNNIDVATLLKYKQRSELMAVFQAQYENLSKSQGVTHFYFHLADGSNLVRFHEPDRYGDRVDRYTLTQARQTGLVSSGFEIGPLGSFNLRVVKPVLFGNSTVGFLELGSEISSLLSQLDALENVDVAFLIHKTAIPAENSKAWDALNNTEYRWKRFDESLLKYASNPELVRMLDKLLHRAHIHAEEHQHQFVVDRDHISNQQLLYNLDVQFEASYRESPALLSIIPFADAAGDYNTDLVLVNNITRSTDLFYQWISISSLLAFVVFILLSSFIYRFLSRIDRGIAFQQAELIDSNDRLNKAMTGTRDGVWDWNLKTQQIIFDDRYYTMAGYQPGEFPSSYQAWVERIHPDDRESVECAVNDYLQNKIEHYDTEFRFQCKDESYIWIRTRGKIFKYDEEGKPLRFVGTHMDISDRKLAQQALAKSEERFRSLVETTYDWIWEVNAQGVYTYASPQCYKLLGFKPDEIVGKTPFDLMPEEEAVRVLKEFQRVLSDRASINALVNINRRKDGTTVVIETSGVPFFHSNGELAGYRGIDRNITERTLIETQLRESEKKYRLLVENQTDMVVEVDAEGRFLFVSPSYCEIFDTSEKELLGNTFMPLVHEEDQESTRKAMEKLNQPPYSCYLEQRAMTRNGWRWLEWMDSAILDEEGNIASIIGVGRDITDRKHFEQQLIDSESRFRAVFNQQYQFMGILSPEGITLEINDLPLNATGFKREDVIGKLFWLTPFWINLPEWADIFKQRLKQVKESGQPVHTQDVYQTADGVTRNAEATTSAIFDEGGEVLFYIIQASDTTDRQNAEQQRDQLLEEVQRMNVNLENRVRERTAALNSVNRELESFSYSVSHDLRAPLRAIDGFSLALLEDYGERLDDTGHDYLNRVRNSAQRMGHLIDDLLQLSRVNRDDISIKNVDLRVMAQKVVEELHSIDPDREIILSLGEDLQAEGDPRLLRIMLDNLLGNAWKFTSKKEKAQITFDRLEENPQVFFIRDNGVGFNMDHAKNLFGAFQRLHRITDFPGTGIGLATVQRILNRHGGYIWAEAKEGEGATFYFSMVIDKSDLT